MMRMRQSDGPGRFQPAGKMAEDPYRWMDNMGGIGVGINTADIWSTGPRFDDVERMSGAPADLPPLEPELFQPTIPDYHHHSGNYDALYERERLEMERRRESERDLERRMHSQLQESAVALANPDLYRDWERDAPQRPTWNQDRARNHVQDEPYRQPAMNRQPAVLPADPFDDQREQRGRSFSNASRDSDKSGDGKKSDPFAGARPREEVLQSRTAGPKSNTRMDPSSRSMPLAQRPANASSAEASRTAQQGPKTNVNSGAAESYDGRYGPRDGGPPAAKRADTAARPPTSGPVWRRGDVPFGRDREYSRRDEHKSRNGFDRPPIDFGFGADRFGMAIGGFGDSMMAGSLIGGSDSVFPGKRSLPRRDFDCDLDDMRMASMMSNMPPISNGSRSWRRDDDRD